MFEREYENPMMAGDYGEEKLPSRKMTCPGCGRVWSGYDFEDDTEWECENEAYSLTYAIPVSEGMCMGCAWEKRTPGHMRRFIEEQSLCLDVLSLFLCGRTGNAISRPGNGKMLWGILNDTQDEPTREWVNDLLQEYISDEAKVDFIDWMLGGGHKRVCVCAGGKNDE